ncbi:hypothetical protein VXE61_20160, partial [Acinetobacter nosocomialis]
DRTRRAHRYPTADPPAYWPLTDRQDRRTRAGGHPADLPGLHHPQSAGTTFRSGSEQTGR